MTETPVRLAVADVKDVIDVALVLVAGDESWPFGEGRICRTG